MASSSTSMPGACLSSSGSWSGTTGRSLTTESSSRPWTRRARTISPRALSVRSGVSKKQTSRICASSGSSSSAWMAERWPASGTVSFSSTLSEPADSASTSCRSSSPIGRPRVVVAATAGSDRRAVPGERGAQLLLLLGAERRLDHLAAVLRDPRQDLVGGAALHEHDDRRAAVLEVLAHGLHEVLLAAIAVPGHRRAGCCADRHAQERREEEEPDDHAAAGALRSAAAADVAGVVELDLLIGAPLD